ncbi:MAG: hypothetical protein NXY57DRAFT_994355 [Lentinula lateritia]|nr:MAG: hypothetical protein NXY57DRAFT_994355 [Lentinula lateritia]
MLKLASRNRLSCARPVSENIFAITWIVVIVFIALSFPVSFFLGIWVLTTLAAPLVGVQMAVVLGTNVRAGVWER